MGLYQPPKTIPAKAEIERFAAFRSRLVQQCPWNIGTCPRVGELVPMIPRQDTNL